MDHLAVEGNYKLTFATPTPPVLCPQIDVSIVSELDHADDVRQ
jgi:hypothetical protein